MTHAEKDKIIQKTLEKCTALLGTKAEIYATNADALHNFRVAAELQRINMKQALVGIMAKHIVSVFDMVHSGEDYIEELWDEKICDSINYLLLLRVAAEEFEL